MAARHQYPVSINDATVAELAAINKVGPFLAQRIISARPFQSVDDLIRVNGIGQKLLDTLRPYLITGKPVENLESEGESNMQKEENSTNDPYEPGEPPESSRKKDEEKRLEEEAKLSEEDAIEADSVGEDSVGEEPIEDEPFEEGPFEERPFEEEPFEEGPLAEDSDEVYPGEVYPEVYAGEAAVAPEPEDSWRLETDEEEASTADPHEHGNEETEEPEPLFGEKWEEDEPIIAVGTESSSVFYPEKGEVKTESEIRQEEAESETTSRRMKSGKELAVIEPAQKPGVRRGEMLAWIAGASLLTLLIAVLISLGTLAIVNNSLRYRTESRALNDAAALQDRLALADSRIEDINADMAGLRTRLDALEPLSGRVSTLETDSGALREDLSETTANLNGVIEEITGIQEEVVVLSEEVAEIQETTGVFENFLLQLKSLLNDIVPENTEGEQP